MHKIFLIVVSCLLIASCTTETKNNNTVATTTITTDGSSTVYPITQAAAEDFMKKNNGVRVTVGISGTGGGFSRFCKGETDISNASRPISKTEKELCVSNGVEFIELPVAFDALSVIVNPNNTWASCLTVSELKTIWSPDSQGVVNNWNQVRSGFPDRRLTLYGPGTDSGTFDYFTGAINGKEKASRGDFLASEDDNVLVVGISGDEFSLGYFGFAYVVENKGKVKPVNVDGGNGCVEPSYENVKNATYQPLSRPIFIYVNNNSAKRAEVDKFIEFYMSNEFTSIISTPEIGYVNLEESVYRNVLARFKSYTTGTLFPDGQEVGATLDRYKVN